MTTSMMLRSRDRLTPTLPVGTGTPYLATAIYRLPVDVQAGDLVDLSGFFQVSTSFEHSIMVGRYLVRHTDPDVFAPGTGGFYVVRPHSQNVRTTLRHNPMWVAGKDRPEESGLRYYSLVAYAASVSAQPSDTLAVDNYGELTCSLLRQD